MHQLLEPELDALCTYLNEQLKKGLIRPSKSPAGASMFFVKKTSGNLQPVVDYHSLNLIVVKS